MSSESLSVTDNRTGKTYELPIEDGTVRGMDLRQIKESDDDFGLMSYDPAFTNTASCRSSVTYVDGAAGLLEFAQQMIDDEDRDSRHQDERHRRDQRAFRSPRESTHTVPAGTAVADPRPQSHQQSGCDERG